MLFWLSFVLDHGYWLDLAHLACLTEVLAYLCAGRLAVVSGVEERFHPQRIDSSPKFPEEVSDDLLPPRPTRLRP